MSAVPTSEELEELFSSGALVPVGKGRRRVCCRIPGTDLCVKCYHSSAVPNATVAREIARARFDARRNTCCQEARYWQELKDRIPSDLFEVFPSVCTCVFTPSHGWCEVESHYEGLRRFTLAYRAAGAGQAELLARFRRLIDGFVRHAVRFYDTQNVMVQPEDRLRIVDFEPASRVLIPLERLSSLFVRRKVARRAKRYLKDHLGIG